VLARLCVATLALLATTYAHADGQLGSMSCHRIAGSGVNLLITSKADVRCTFVGDQGSEQWYMGETGIKLGLDLKFTVEETIGYLVLSSTVKYTPEGEFLSGNYVGAKADAALGIALGAAVLVGGSNDTMALQPAISAGTGVGAALGLGFLEIESDPLNRARIATPYGNTITQSMYAGYFGRAFDRYHEAEADYAGSDYFANRAITAAGGTEVAPESPSKWTLSPAQIDEVTPLRERLIKANERGQYAPVHAGRAVVSFDCWLHGLGNGITDGSTQACKTTLLTHIDAVETAASEVDLMAFAMRPQWYMALFDTDADQLDELALLSLENVKRQLSLLTDARVHVKGNTDRVGSKVYNQQLAERRTMSVIEALKAMDVPAAWITGEAFGAENPISISKNPHDALNRRVDITIQPIAADKAAIEKAAKEIR
jgi:flagellar motor protein MotB